ncbi:MAG: hypothetical protein REH83_04665 [Rickettsiella sp.]|nr:hypothetical protein [Rickettsiella sp.]
MLHLRTLLKVLALSSIVFSTSASADFRFPLPPRLSANGYGSDYAVGQADLMLPIKGDFAHNLYFDPNLGLASDNQGYVDLGIGYRWIQNTAAILGGYLFAGYSRLENNAHVWVLNPGIEALGSRWDGHFNAYFPMGDRNVSLGNYQAFGFFNNHSQFNNLFQLVQSDAVGADIIVGYQLLPQTPLKAYAGSYVFAPNGGNIVGGALGVEYWVREYLKVFVSYSYDNVRHSTGALGFGVEFGGSHTHRSDPGLEERMTDPVQRYLAELGHGSKIPTRKYNNQISGPFVVLNNIAFFSQSGVPNNGGTGLSLQNCTFENPCGPTDLTNAATSTLAGLLPNTTINLGGGTYAAVDVLGGSNGVTLQTGQSITGNGSTLAGAINLSGNNSLTDIILLPIGSTVNGSGVDVAAGTTLTIGNSQIGSPSNAFATGISISGSGQAVITDSRIFSNTTGIASAGTNLTVNGTSVTTSNGTNPIGISLNAGGSLNLGAGSSVTVSGSGNSIGINQAVGGSSNITTTGIPVTVTGTGQVIGINQGSGNTGNLTVSGGSIVVNGGNSSIGVGLNSSGATSITGGTPITVTGANNTTGLEINSNGTVNLGNDTSITVNGATTTTGISSNSSGSITTGTGTTINVTGGDNTSGVHCTGASDVDITGGLIHVIGGLDSVGLYLEGNGIVSLRGTIVTIEGGVNTIGIKTTAASDIIIDSLSSINVTGGIASMGIFSTGSGFISLLGGSFITLNGENNVFISGINLAAGSTNSLLIAGQSGIRVIGVDDCVGILTLSSGTVGITEASLLEVIGGINTYGISAVGIGSVQLAGGSKVQVMGNAGSIGINTETVGGLSITEGALINVVGHGIGIGPITGINALNLGTVVGNQVNISVGNTNPNGQAIGLVTNNTAAMNISDVTVTVLGDNTSFIKQVLGGTISLSNCTAILNGVLQPVCI